MKTILHITTHMGGGVGKALSGLCAYAEEQDVGYKHKIILLEKPEKTNFIDVCRNHHVDISIADDINCLKTAMMEADLVQLEWWHHPIMAGFLAKFPEIPVRLVIWSHIAGTYYPWIPAEFVKIPDKFIFTSLCSYDNPYWSKVEQKDVQKNSLVINSSGGFEIKKIKKQEQADFRIGYVGTQAFSKLNRDFIGYCKAVTEVLSRVNFVMVGDMTNKQSLLQEAEACGIADKFSFIDYVDDVNAEFAKMDIFGYLLNPLHFGTTENVLLEAMVAGLPVICMEQAAERYIVQHNKTGVLVNDKQGYAAAVYELYKNKAKREALGKAARRYVLENFNVADTAKKLHGIYDEILKQKKRYYSFESILGNEPYEYFRAGLPPDLKGLFSISDNVRLNGEILPPILREKNKSSLQHFARSFPFDLKLKKWLETVHM